MKIAIKKADFRDILSKVQGLTGRKTNLAITENVLIRTVGSGISLIATDMETGLEGYYPAEVMTEGVIAVHAKKLFEIVRDFPKDMIVLNEVENRWIEIGGGTIEYHIVGMNPEDFPEVPMVEEADFFPVEGIAFRKMIEKTIAVAGASDDKRPHIIGNRLDRIFTETEKKIRMVSTDGGRLAKVDIFCHPEDPVMESEGILIPKKGLGEAAKFLDTNEIIRIGVVDTHFVIRKESETLTVRLLEGDYPDFSGLLIKNEDAYILEVDRVMFQKMLKRMSILSTEEYKGVVFNFEKDLLTVTTTNPELGESREEMSVDYEGELLEIAFNPRFFIESLQVIEEETVLLYFSGAKRPCLVEGKEDKSYLGVIMPMSL